MHEEARYRSQEILRRLNEVANYVTLPRQGSLGGETVRDYETLGTSMGAPSPEGGDTLATYFSTGTQGDGEFVDCSSPISSYSMSTRSPSFGAISPRTSVSASTGMSIENEKPCLLPTSPFYVNHGPLASAVVAGGVDKVKDIIRKDRNNHSVSEAHVPSTW
jgi:hypothetical protein